MAEIIPERVLVARCKAGDHAAFVELIRRSSPFALRAIRVIALNPADADDIMQDTLLKAFKGFHYFNERSKFSTWLTSIAINNALIHHRRRKKRIEISLDVEVDEGGNRTFRPADNRINPEEALIRDQSVAIIRAAIDALPTHLRLYVKRRCLDELSHKEVSSSLGISLVAGKSRALRARQRLGASLAVLLSVRRDNGSSKHPTIALSQVRKYGVV